MHWNCRSHRMVHCHRCLHWDWRAVFFCLDCCSCRFVNHWYIHCTRYHGDVRGSDLVTMPLPYSNLCDSFSPLLCLQLRSLCVELSSPLLTWPDDSPVFLVLFAVLDPSITMPGNLQLLHVELFCRLSR